jgi:predicted membrane channel-forming protein YqfA (hemolysin III family)
MDEVGDKPDESEQARLSRNMAELLQELRVAQAGVQILFAFLLSVAFTNRFATASAFQRGTLIITIVLATAAAVLLMAPAAWHRLYFRKGRREEILYWGNRFALTGLGLLAAAMTGVILLVVDAVAGIVLATVIASCAALLFGTVWFAVPVARRARGLVDDDNEGRTNS